MLTFKEKRESQTLALKGINTRVADNSPILELNLSISGTIREIIQKAKQFAKDNFVGSSVRNDDTYQDINISMKGVKHTLSGNTGHNLAKSVFMIPDLIRKSKFIESLPDKKNNKSVKLHHYFGIKLNIDGKVHDIVIDVREMTDGHWYYDHSFERSVGGTTPLSKPDKPVTGITPTAEPLSSALNIAENKDQSTIDSIFDSANSAYQLSFSEKRALQKAVTEQNKILAGNSLFTEKRQAQKAKLEAF